MMSLLWYYRPEHLQGGRSPSMHEVSCLAGEGGRTRGCGIKTHIGRGQLAGSQVPWVLTSQTVSQLMFQMGIMTLEGQEL